jgi:hypothetical protein
MKLKENFDKQNKFDSRKNSLTKPDAHYGDPALMKSPSSPNVMQNPNN